MFKFNIGETFIVPHAYEWIFEPTQITISDLLDNNGTKLYGAECHVHDMTAAAGTNPCQKRLTWFKEEELFPCTKDGLRECREYIEKYYYGKLCDGCKYEKYIEDFHCDMCTHCQKIATKSTETALYRCDINNIVVGSQYTRPIGKEICKYFETNLPQEQKLYRSWEEYIDLLQNCEFNQECDFHKYSCHGTCTYERYINQPIGVRYSFTFDQRKVNTVRILRKRWMEQDFISSNLLKCVILNFDYRRSNRGKILKEDLPISKAWETEISEETKFGIWTYKKFKEVIIDIEKGEVVGETGELC